MEASYFWWELRVCGLFNLSQEQEGEPCQSVEIEEYEETKEAEASGS